MSSQRERNSILAALKIVVLVLVLGAVAGLAYAYLEARAPQKSADVVDETSGAGAQETVVDDSDGQTTWVMSSGDLALTTPSDWEVTQADAGGASTVSARDSASLDSGAVRVRIFVGEEFGTGETISYADWLLEKSAGLTSCENKEIGGLSMSCFIDPYGMVKSYFGQRQDDRFNTLFFIVINDDENNSTNRAVLESLNFSPNKAQNETATVIP
ncbi:MAG: hypothetical protein AAB337_02195 [Patescibacteria group bacterium]